MDTNEYIIEILERVKGLETMLRDYAEVEDNSDEAKALALQAKQEVDQLIEKLEAKDFETKDTKQWSRRTIVAAIVSMFLMLLANIVLMLLKVKMGW